MYTPPGNTSSKKRSARWLLVLAVSAPLAAMTVDKTAITKALDHADLIAEIEPVKIDVSQRADGLQVARTTVRVLRVLRAREGLEREVAGEEELVVEVPGGERDGIGISFSGYTRPYLGRRYEVHLNRKEGTLYRIAGMQWGLRELGVSRTQTRNRTDGSNGSGTGAFLHWMPNRFPIPYFVSLPTFRGLPAFAEAVDRSFSAWKSVAGTSLDFVPMGCTNALRNENDGVNSVIILRTAWPFEVSAIAITRNFYIADESADAGSILDSDVLLNSQYHSFTTTGEAGKHDVQNIVTHEVGHFIGFGHEAAPEDASAVMFAMASAGETSKRTLKANDMSNMLAAYGGTFPKRNYGTTNASCNLDVPRVGGCLRVSNPEDSYPSTWSGFAGALLFITFLIGRRIARRSH